jgi:glutathione S-transferase
MPQDLALPAATLLVQLAYPAFVTLIAVLLYTLLTFNVGRARMRFNIPPPQTTGNLDFERFLRVQQNTLEQLMFFLPSLWLASLYSSAKLSALLGLIWIIGRLLYANGYYKAAPKRMLGFMINIFISSILLLMGLIGSIQALV